MKTKKWLLSILTICLFFLISCSCPKNEGVTSGPLDRLNWSDKNYQVLNRLIKDYGTGGKYYDKNKAPYVVFDWDQTCAHLDVGEATMRFQMFNLRYKITKEEFKGLLKDEINGIAQLSADHQNIKLADINQDLINDYNFLYDNFSGLNGKMTLEEIKATPQYNDFIAKIPYLYDGYCTTPGIGEEYGLAWVIYLYAGHTTDEIKAIARETISYELANQLGKQILQSPANFKTKAGVVGYSYKSGLRVLPEMQNLISTFKDYGIEVFIVSASYKQVVEEFSGIGLFGYNIPSSNVIAMELALSGEGKILPEYKTGWVKTFGQGKVEAINMAIKTGLGRNWDPILAGGDSDGDYQMSTEFPGMKLTLIWNKVKGGSIGKLCKLAVDEVKNPTPRYILQGRNENTGVAMPCSETILFGKTEPQLLY